MKIIARERGTGKTEELLRLASEDKALVLTSNKRALQEKANAYGIPVQIVDLNDLIYGNYTDYDRLYVHKLDDVMEDYFWKDFSLNLKGFSIALGD